MDGKLLQFMRMNNIFGPQPSAPMDEVPNPIGMPNPMEQPMPQMMPMQEDASNRMDQMIGQFPTRQDPSKFRQVLGFIGALGGKDKDKILYPNYDRELGDWKEKFTPIKAAAELERFTNANNRQTNTSIANQETANRRVTVAERNATTAKERSDASARTAAIRANAYDYRSRNVQSKFEEDSEGYIIAIDPLTNRVEYLTDDQGNKVKSSEMPEADKINLQIKGQKEVAAVRGAEARRTRAVVPGGSVNDPSTELPTQTRIRYFNKANEALNMHPDWAPFIKVGAPGSNDFELVKPNPTAWFNKGPAKDTYDEIVKFIYGAAPQSQSKLVEAGKTPRGENIPPEGKIKVQKFEKGKPVGQAGMIPLKRLAEYEKGGYKKVQ